MMYFTITRITEDIYEICFNDESVSSSVMLSDDEMTLLLEVISEYPKLSVSATSGKWYNS